MYPILVHHSEIRQSDNQYHQHTPEVSNLEKQENQPLKDNPKSQS